MLNFCQISLLGFFFVFVALDVCFRPPPTTTPDALNNNNHHHHQQPSPNNEMSDDRGVTVSAGNTPLRQPRRMSSGSPPYRLTPDGTLVNYWCDMSPVTRRDSGKGGFPLPNLLIDPPMSSLFSHTFYYYP